MDFGVGPGVGGTAVDVINGQIAAGVTGLQIDNRIIQTISPIAMGQVTINAPVQSMTDSALLRPGEPAQSAGTGATRTSDLISGRPAPGSREGLGGPVGAPSFDPASPVNVPAGAQIAPRSFAQYKGRSLLEWASLAAQRHGIPLNILNGIVDHESNWLHTAVGDNGTSFGLAQIHLTSDAFGGVVSKSQALDPIYALNWAANHLKNNFQKYGTWEAAIAAHNSPVAAQHLSRTGKFQNRKSAEYVADVMSKSNQSGLANTVFNDSDISFDIEGEGPSGPTYSPFQAPDPAGSREFIESTFQSLLGRKPTEEELEEGVGRIADLAMRSYQSNLTQAKGGESQAVDVEAQFIQSIKDTGEFGFSEETHQLDSFTDYAAGVARLLQQGI